VASSKIGKSKQAMVVWCGDLVRRSDDAVERLANRDLPVEEQVTEVDGGERENVVEDFKGQVDLELHQIVIDVTLSSAQELLRELVRIDKLQCSPIHSERISTDKFPAVDRLDTDDHQLTTVDGYLHPENR